MAFIYAGTVACLYMKLYLVLALDESKSMAPILQGNSVNLF